MRHPDDDALMGVLREALVPADLQPSAEEMAHFSRVLEASRPGTRRVASMARHAPWQAHAMPRLLVAAAVVLLAGLGALSGGVATDSLPGPLRSAAFDLGLPVSSPSLVAAEAASAALAGALAAKDRAAVISDVPVLEQRLAALGSADRMHIEPVASTLLAQAAEFLATTAPVHTPAPSGDDGAEGGASSASTPETTEPSGQTEGSSSESSPASTPEPSASGDGTTTQSREVPTTTTSVPAGSTTVANSGGDGSSSSDSSATGASSDN